MLVDQLLEAIQADRNRQIREADRVRLLTPVEVEPATTATAGMTRRDAVRLSTARGVPRQPRPATDSPR